jgi:molybdenum cofactor biosynthesis enzyme MoaA
MLAEADMKKLNISGGEPSLQDEIASENIIFSKSQTRAAVDIMCNGSKVSEKWLDQGVVPRHHGRIVRFLRRRNEFEGWKE